MILTVDIPYPWGTIVYLKTDTEQRPYIVIGVKLCCDGGLLVELQAGTVSSFHYPVEISAEKNILLTT